MSFKRFREKLRGSSHIRAGALLLLLGLTLVRGMIYSAIIPPWQAPDEPRHVEYVKLLYEKRRLVGWRDVTPSVEEEIIISMDEHDFWRFGRGSRNVSEPGELPQTLNDIWPGFAHELHQPPLSYLLYVLPLSLVPTEDIALQLYAMRLTSVILGALVVLTAFLSTKELFPNDDFSHIAVPALIVFLPMHTFLVSTVNNDHLAELAVSLLFLVLIRIFKKGFSMSRMLGVCVLIVIGSLAKRTALVAIPTCLAMVPVYLWRREAQTTFNWRGIVLVMSVAAVVIGMGIHLWEKAQAALNQLSPKLGDWMDMDYIREIYLFLPSERFLFSFQQQYFGPEAIRSYKVYIQTIFESFWGRFGWMNIRFNAFSYQLLALVSLAAFAGLCLFAIRTIKGPDFLAQWQRKSLLLFSLSVFFALFIIVANEIRRWDLGWGGKPQGRFLFPVIIPISTFFTLGLREFVPARYRKLWLFVYVGSFILLDSVSLIYYIIPFFYG